MAMAKAGPSVLDVAELSGVSPSTVCRVINGRSNVSGKAKEKVLKACASLGFRKNAAASLLRLRKSKTIACLMPDQAHEMFIDKMEHLKREVFALGRPWRFHSYRSEEEAAQLLDEIVAARPAGLISGWRLDEESKRLLASNDIAVVCYDMNDPDCDSVALDRASGVYEAVSYILSQGRRKLLAVGFALDSERGQGCVRAFVEAGRDPASISFFSGLLQPDLFHFGYATLREAYGKFDFDSVLAVNDAAAIGAMRFLAERGIKVPRDIAVIGFDDIMVSSFTTPSLSTVAQPSETLAKKTVEFLERRLAEGGSSLERQFALLKTSFSKRESA